MCVLTSLDGVAKWSRVMQLHLDSHVSAKQSGFFRNLEPFVTSSAVLRLDMYQSVLLTD